MTLQEDVVRALVAKDTAMLAKLQDPKLTLDERLELIEDEEALRTFLSRVDHLVQSEVTPMRPRK